jgi:hypothetical protein
MIQGNVFVALFHYFHAATFPTIHKKGARGGKRKEQTRCEVLSCSITGMMNVRIFELLHQKDVLLMAKCTGMFGLTFFARGLVIKIEEFYNYTSSPSLFVLPFQTPLRYKFGGFSVDVPG